MLNPQAADTPLTAHAPPANGRIDIHCHLVPGIDDGCHSLEETIQCIRMLQAAGFAGSICTPHVWPQEFPKNTPQTIAAAVAQLQQQLADRGVSYQLWPGGELRIFEGVIDWIQAHGVPTLAGSRCVLTDLWDADWPDYVLPAFDWLLGHGYQPILAHPERMPCVDVLCERLDEVAKMGVWLQANSRCMVGEEGYHPDQLIRRFLAENRYQLMALDVHRPPTLQSRLDGLSLVEAEFSKSLLDDLTVHAPRNLVLNHAALRRR